MNVLTDPVFVRETQTVRIDSLHGLLGDQEFKLGYTHAKNEVLAMHPLLIEQFIRARGIESRQHQELLRSFGRFVDEKADQYLPASSDQYVSDGLGI